MPRFSRARLLRHVYFFEMKFLSVTLLPLPVKNATLDRFLIVTSSASEILQTSGTAAFLRTISSPFGTGYTGGIFNKTYRTLS